MNRYTYHQDPGHGWIAVPVAEVIALGIADKVSHYSYIRSGVVYLEEDCDASLWLRAREAADGHKPTLIEVHSNYDSVIRNYPSYNPTLAANQAIVYSVPSIKEQTA